MENSYNFIFIISINTPNIWPLIENSRPRNLCILSWIYFKWSNDGESKDF